jgi:hypothetical protein
VKDFWNLVLILAAFTLGYWHTGAPYVVQYIVGLCVVLYLWFAVNMVVRPILLEVQDLPKMTDEEWKIHCEEVFFLAYHLGMHYNAIMELSQEQRRHLINKYIEENKS